MKEFDSKTLEEFNGRDGRQAFIAHGGKVFDISASRMWKDGLHMKRHRAGRDLSAEISAAPHGPEVFERISQVGVFRGEAGDAPAPLVFTGLMARWPMLRRHPHPMMVHFPIVFIFAVFLFDSLYLASGVGSFEITALHCLGAGLLFIPPAMATGYLTWKINYLGKPLKPVAIKKKLSWILLFVAAGAFAWRLSHPDILLLPGTGRILYLGLVISLFAMAVAIAYYGGRLTFPYED